MGSTGYFEAVEGIEIAWILTLRSHWQSPVAHDEERLPTTNYQLPTTNYQLPTTNYQLPTNDHSQTLRCWL